MILILFGVSLKWYLKISLDQVLRIIRAFYLMVGYFKAELSLPTDRVFSKSSLPYTHIGQIHK